MGGLAVRRARNRSAAQREMDTARQRIRLHDILSATISPEKHSVHEPAVAGAARHATQALGRSSAQPDRMAAFQLAFILLNIAGLSDRRHADRENRRPAVLSHRRRQDRSLSRRCGFVIAIGGSPSGVLGAVVAVIMPTPCPSPLTRARAPRVWSAARR